MHQILQATTEQDFWLHAKHIVHFIGPCGAGKTTMSTRMAERCRKYGGKAIGTVDWDPHIPDDQRAADRAFSRMLDQRNNAASGKDQAVHEDIVQYSLAMIASWERSDANLVLVDRWYESYDDFPFECATQINNALAKSGFTVTVVNLHISAPAGAGSDIDAMSTRLVQTRANRPESWWTSEMGTVVEMARAECAYQDSYREFCLRSPFTDIQMPTADMDWDSIEDTLVESLQFSWRWRDLDTEDAKSALTCILGKLEG